MRSELVFDALTHLPNRFQLVRVASKAARELHRLGARIQDTMNDVFGRFKHTDPIAHPIPRRDVMDDQIVPRAVYQSRQSRPQIATQRIASGNRPDVVEPVPGSQRISHGYSLLG
jgi:hypothetical protein